MCHCHGSYTKVLRHLLYQSLRRFDIRLRRNILFVCLYHRLKLETLRGAKESNMWEVSDCSSHRCHPTCWIWPLHFSPKQRLTPSLPCASSITMCFLRERNAVTTNVPKASLRAVEILKNLHWARIIIQLAWDLTPELVVHEISLTGVVSLHTTIHLTSSICLYHGLKRELITLPTLSI